MLLGTENIVDLIPQKPPMVMVGQLISHDNVSAQSAFSLNKENIFCEKGFLSEAGIIENMAQTAALRSGYEAKLKGQHPHIGFIGSLKHIQIYFLPRDTEQLHTTVTVQNELMQALIIKCETKIGTTLVAEGEMTIFLKDNDNER
jgi:predicted hotdog family 3-hydroxylacyl-ACP dehydratase